MHEPSLMADLMRKLAEVARTHHARRIITIRVQLGALSHISPEHFQDHFELAVRGSAAEGCQLDIEVLADPRDPRAQDLVLLSVDLEPATADGKPAHLPGTEKS